MSRDYPCVYYDNEKCKKFSEDGITSYCVLGPCSYETPSNADRIRAMTDEELAEFIISGTERSDFYIEGVDWLEKEELFNWLQQPCGGADCE